jgi:hypothetical protein
MLKMTRRRIVIAALLTLGLGYVLFWFYWPGLSEESALTLATARVQEYARLNGLDLSQYGQPTVRGQRGVALYGFVWKPKGDGPTIVADVDARTTDVTVTESVVLHP